MDLVPDDKARGLKAPIWDEYKKIINTEEGKEVGLEFISHLPHTKLYISMLSKAGTVTPF